jgi:hypothetical protein
MNEPPNPEVAIFATALELATDKRGTYLDQACAGDVALRRQVEALLRVHDDAGNFFGELASLAQPTSGGDGYQIQTAPFVFPPFPRQKPATALAATSFCNKLAKADPTH